jgi:transcriptional regulator GlxA family with amidase domain
MDRRVRAVIAFMKGNLHRPLSPAQMAKLVHLSPSHLRQLFKSEIGTSLARYLRQQRMAQAQKLLETTFLSVKEVAANVGITEVSHFVRDFEKAYGVTPARHAARYRRAHGAERYQNRNQQNG